MLGRRFYTASVRFLLFTVVCLPFQRRFTVGSAFMAAAVYFHSLCVDDATLFAGACAFSYVLFYATFTYFMWNRKTMAQTA